MIKGGDFKNHGEGGTETGPEGTGRSICSRSTFQNL